MPKRKYAFTESLQSEWTFLEKSTSHFVQYVVFSFEHKSRESTRKKKKETYVAAIR